MHRICIAQQTTASKFGNLGSCGKKVKILPILREVLKNALARSFSLKKTAFSFPMFHDHDGAITGVYALQGLRTIVTFE